MTDKKTAQDNGDIGDTHLSTEAMEKIERLLSSVPPRELRENLLEIYHTYLIYVHDVLPVGFEKIALNMYLLINCLRDIDMKSADVQDDVTGL